MEGFDPATSFGYEVSRRYDADDTRGDEAQIPTAPSRPGHHFGDAEHVGVDHVVLDDERALAP